MNKEYLNFIKESLIPCANELLRRKYEAYCNGEDIGIEIKDDNSPASLADRKTEAALRKLIEQTYPDHGIWGEEYGAANIDRDWIWVLDPLDGTKEFLSKDPLCFGSLIGLLYQGKTILGAVSDPINNRVWISDAKQPPLDNIKCLKESVIACTSPDDMFIDYAEKQSIQDIQNIAQDFKTKCNCIGFANVADGTIDAVVENRLKIHDIVPLIPILLNAGATLLDFEGNNYASFVFDPPKAKIQKYSIIASANPDLAQEILSIFKKQAVA